MNNTLASLLTAITLLGPASAACADVWKPHYTKLFSLGETMNYWWTKADGTPLELDGDGNTVKHSASLLPCIPQSIAVPYGAKDVDWDGWWLFLTGRKICAGKADALEEGADGTFGSDLQAFYDSTGVQEIHWPSGFGNGDIDVYWGVDVKTYYQATGGQFQYNQEYHIVNGSCAELPGYVFGTAPVYLDPYLGLETSNPIADAYVTSFAEEGLAPEPSSAVLLFTWIAALGGMTRRR